jgi:aldehyde:ferredoxin oxidoreductase
VTFALTPDKVCALFNAATGENLTLEDWNLAGERIWNLERMFNLRAGLGRKDDTLPPRMLKEPLSGGMVQGQVVELEPMLEEYYRIRGWDEEGRPKQETLARLGLS